MSAEFVQNFETWPAAERLGLEVLSDDGELAKLYSPSQAEVTLIERLDGKQLIVPLAFHSLERAEKAGKILADAFEAVRAIQDEPKPHRCNFHQWHVGLFARNVKHTAVCKRCGTVADLVPRKADDA